MLLAYANPALALAVAQVLAARKLFRYCRAGKEVQRAVVEAKGVHMLLIMLDSLDNTVRDLCTRTLTDLAADERVRYTALGCSCLGRPPVARGGTWQLELGAQLDSGACT